MKSWRKKWSTCYCSIDVGRCKELQPGPWKMVFLLNYLPRGVWAFYRATNSLRWSSFSCLDTVASWGLCCLTCGLWPLACVGQLQTSQAYRFWIGTTTLRQGSISISYSLCVYFFFPQGVLDIVRTWKETSSYHFLALKRTNMLI